MLNLRFFTAFKLPTNGNPGTSLLIWIGINNDNGWNGHPVDISNNGGVVGGVSVISSQSGGQAAQYFLSTQWYPYQVTDNWDFTMSAGDG
jgi:hypothetical protein